MNRKARILAIVLGLLLAAGVAFATPTPETSGPVTLSVLLFDRTTPGFTPDNSLQSKWIQENVKKALGYDVKFVTMPRFPDVEKVNVLMASAQAPDVTFLYNEGAVMNYIKSGGLTDLGPLIDKYAPKMKKLLGPDVLSFGRWGGVQWAIPAKRTLVARAATFIRKDWTDKLGLALPTTMDQWYNALVQFKAKDPGNTGGKVIPYEFQGVITNDIDWNAQTLLPAFLKQMSAEDRAVLGGTARWMQPGYKDGIRYLNKLYNEGLLGHDFPLDKDGEQYKKDVAQGLVGSVIHNWDDPYRAAPGLQAELAKNVPGGLFVPIDPFVNYAGKHEKPKYNPNGFYIFVPSFSKNAVAAVKYLEWMSDPAVYGFLTNGIKGVHYTDEVDGIPVNYVPQDKLADDQKTHWIDFAILLNGKEFGSDEKNAEAAALGSSYSQGYGPQLKQGYLVGMKDALFPIHWDVILESESKYSGTLSQKGAEIWVKTISAAPSEFDALYDSMVKEWLSIGGQAVIDEKHAAYKAMMAAKK